MTPTMPTKNLIEPNRTNVTSQEDFNLHDAIGVRLVDASPGDIKTVARQLGPIQARLHSEPDIRIRFVDRLPGRETQRYLGLDDCGFTDDAFVVLKTGKEGTRLARIDFDRIGESCEIVCEHGIPSVPLLIPILNLTALAKGILPLHASAFQYKGTGVLTTGWSKGGKTETLLAFGARGADYVGDEWVYLHPDGLMGGIPERIRVWDWHMQHLPEFRVLAGRDDQRKIRMIRSFLALGHRLPHAVQRSFAGRILDRLEPPLRRQMYADMPPARIFGDRRQAGLVSLDKVFFVISHASSEVTFDSADGLDIARRMAASLHYERLDFLGHYAKFRFAFPDRGNPFIDEANEQEKALLVRYLGHKECHVLAHPYPVALGELFDAVEPLLNR